MPRKWADSGTGTILLRNMHEEKPKQKHKNNADEINAQNEVKKICLECVKETCSGNCRRFRKKNEK